MGCGVLGFGVRGLGFGFWGLGFEFSILGFGFRVLGVGVGVGVGGDGVLRFDLWAGWGTVALQARITLRLSGFGIRGPRFVCQVLGFVFLVSGFGFRH